LQYKYWATIVQFENSTILIYKTQPNRCAIFNILHYCELHATCDLQLHTRCI